MWWFQSTPRKVITTKTSVSRFLPKTPSLQVSCVYSAKSCHTYKTYQLFSLLRWKQFAWLYRSYILPASCETNIFTWLFLTDFLVFEPVFYFFWGLCLAIITWNAPSWFRSDSMIRLYWYHMPGKLYQMSLFIFFQVNKFILSEVKTFQKTMTSEQWNIMMSNAENGGKHSNFRRVQATSMLIAVF